MFCNHGRRSIIDEGIAGKLCGNFLNLAFYFEDFPFEPFAFRGSIHDPFEREAEDADIGWAGGKASGNLFAERERFGVKKKRKSGDDIGHPAGCRSKLPREPLVRGNVVGRAQVAGLGNGGIHGISARVRHGAAGFRPRGLQQALRAEAESAPKFLGDEWRIGMQQFEDPLDRKIHHRQRSGAARRVKVRFGSLNEAVTKIPPDKIIKRLRNVAEPERFVAFAHTFDRGIELREKVAGEDREIVV